MNSFNCYIHFTHGERRMDCRCMHGSVSCVIHPQLLGKVRQTYIARIWGLLYFFLRYNSWDKMRDIYQWIAVRQYWIPLNDVTRWQTTLLRSPLTVIHPGFHFLLVPAPLSLTYQIRQNLLSFDVKDAVVK